MEKFANNKIPQYLLLNDSSSNVVQYKLVAIVTHLGTMANNGHYITIGCCQDGYYYTFDDMITRTTTIEDLNSSSYIVLYELIESEDISKSIVSTINDHLESHFIDSQDNIHSNDNIDEIDLSDTDGISLIDPSHNDWPSSMDFTDSGTEFSLFNNNFENLRRSYQLYGHFKKPIFVEGVNEMVLVEEYDAEKHGYVVHGNFMGRWVKNDIDEEKINHDDYVQATVSHTSAHMDHPSIMTAIKCACKGLSQSREFTRDQTAYRISVKKKPYYYLGCTSIIEFKKKRKQTCAKSHCPSGFNFEQICHCYTTWVVCSESHWLYLR